MNRTSATLRERLQSAATHPLLLDGPTGTELTRRGLTLPPPLWSAVAITAAPDLLTAIHRDYVHAGADLITANTFRSHARNLPAPTQAAALTARAVELARAAANDHAWVLGSQAPLEDCYSPDLTPPDDALTAEHTAHAEHLLAAGVDGILVETMPTIREAVAATRAAMQTDLPVLVSFVCGAPGQLLSGEDLGEAVRAVLVFEPAAVMVNCCAAPDLHAQLAALRASAPDRVIGGYGNTARFTPHGWEDTPATDPDHYASLAAHWVALGAGIIGACCGATPAHIAKLRELLSHELS